MSMFEELFALANDATLTLVVSADTKAGKMTVAVIPKPKDDHGEPALRQPLSLTASPQEFDAGFVETLRSYREVRTSLAEQVAATREVLEAAKSASVKKASEATSQASKAASTPAKPVVAQPKSDAHAHPQGGETAPEAAPQQPEAMDLFG